MILGEARSGFGQAQQQSTQKSNLVSYLHTQHFICNTGYTPDLCHQHTLKLATVLARYHDELPSDWTWVLVRSDDWPTILRSLNLDTRSPAFTVLAKRQTFFNEALFGDDARQSAGLLRDFKIPLNQILDVAVSHELGHAFCSETRERDADRFAGQLRQTGAARCSGSQTPSTRDTIHTLEAPR